MRRLAYLLLALYALPLASASYYADVTLDVARDGSVTISGITNHPDLSPRTTQALTSKSREYWLLNLTVPETLDEFVITVVLPEGASLNYVSARSSVSIGSSDNRIVIKRVGSNNSVSLAAQYSFDGSSDESALALIGGAAAAVLLVLGGAYLLRRKPRRAQASAAKPTSIVDGLPSRQREIVRLLERADGKLTQKQIEDAMSIPKSSVSRNIDALVRRGLVRKDQHGMTNTISLVR